MRSVSSTSHLTPEIERILDRTPRDRWSAYAVLVDEETSSAKLMVRGELVAQLRAGDLLDLASEAANRRVPPGGLLVLFLGQQGPKFQIIGVERRAPGVPRGSTAPRRARVPRAASVGRT